MTSTLIDEMIAAAEVVKPLGHVAKQDAEVFLAFYRAIQAYDEAQKAIYASVATSACQHEFVAYASAGGYAGMSSAYQECRKCGYRPHPTASEPSSSHPWENLVR